VHRSLDSVQKFFIRTGINNIQDGNVALIETFLSLFKREAKGFLLFVVAYRFTPYYITVPLPAKVI
jgi:hypothetical protein